MGLRVRVRWRAVRAALADAGMLGGAGAITFGCWQWSPPLGYVVGGLLLFALSYLMGGETVTRDPKA